jgi:hypothetical protein
MDRDDVTRLNIQRAVEVAAPLIREIASGVPLDLEADDYYWLRALTDFARRLFDAGFVAGSTDVSAQVIEKLPPGATVNVWPHADPVSGPLGEGPGWEAAIGPNGLLPPERLRCKRCGGIGYYPNAPGQTPAWHICQGCNGRGTFNQKGPLRERPETS